MRFLTLTAVSVTVLALSQSISSLPLDPTKNTGNLISHFNYLSKRDGIGSISDSDIDDSAMVGVGGDVGGDATASVGGDADAGSDSGAGAGAKSGSGAKSGAGAGAGTGAGADAGAGSDNESGASVGANAGADAQSGSGPDGESSANTGANTGAESSDKDEQGHGASSYAKSDANAHSDS